MNRDRQRRRRAQDSRRERYIRRNVQVEQQIKEVVLGSRQNITLHFRNNDLNTFVLTPINELIFSEEFTDNDTRKQQTLDEVTFNYQRYQSGLGTHLFQAILKDLPDGSRYFINDRALNKKLPFNRSITQNHCTIIAQTNFCFTPLINWRLGKNYTSVDQLVPRLNINTYLRQMQNDQFQRFPWEWPNDDDAYISQENLNRILESQIDLFAVNGIKFLYDHARDTNRLQEEQVQISSTIPEIQAIFRTHHVNELNNYDNLNLGNFVQIMSEVLASQFSNRDLRAVIIGAMNLQITNQRQIARFRNVFDLVRAENNQLTYQNKNTLMHNGTNIQNQVINTFFDPRVDLPFDLAFEDPDPDQMTRPYIAQITRELMRQTRFYITTKGLWTPAMYLIFYQMICYKLRKIVCSVIKRGNRMWGYAFYRLISKYAVLGARSAKAFFKIEQQNTISIFMYPDSVTTNAEHLERKTLFIDIFQQTFNRIIDNIDQVFQDPVNGIFAISVQNMGIDTMQQILAITKRPENIVSINRNQNPNPRPIVPSYAKYVGLFVQQFKAIQEFLLPKFPAVLRNRAFSRGMDFKTIKLTSELSTIMALQPYIEKLILRQILDILQLINSHNYQQIIRSIGRWKIFIGFQFVKLIPNDNDYVKPIYRSNGFWIHLTDLAFNPLNQQIPLFFSGVQILANVAVVDGQVVQEHLIRNIALVAPPRSIQDIEQWGIIEQVVDAVNTDVIFRLAQDAWQISGDDSQQPVPEQEHQDVHQLFSINSITIFSLPQYRNVGGATPLLAQLKHAPVSSSFHKPIHLIKDITKTQVQMWDQNTQYSFMNNQDEQTILMFIERVQCTQQVMWTFCQCLLVQYDDIFFLSTLLQNMLQDPPQERYNFDNMLLSIQTILLNTGVKINILIYFIQSSKLVTFDHNVERMREQITNYLIDEINNELPVIVVTSAKSPAHCFVSRLKFVKQYIDQLARRSLREIKSKFNMPDCYTLYKTDIYEKKSPKVQREQISKNIMNSVWTLDIQTTNSIGRPMQPYCIVVWNGQESVFKCIGQPEDVKSQFREFLSDLQNSRNHQSPQIVIYAHNGAKFDWVVLMRLFLRVFDDVIVFGRYADAKYLVIPSINIHLADFYLMVSDTLQNIANVFKTNTRKMQCQEIKTIDTFQNIPQQTVQKIFQYCTIDCKCLWQCISAFVQKVVQIINPEQKQIKRNIVLPPTSSKLAINIFSAKFLKQQKLHGNMSIKIDKIQTQAYFGGVTQVFNFKQQFNCRYIDVNSLYPYAMTKVLISSRPATQADNLQFTWKLGMSCDYLNIHYLYLVQKFQFKQFAVGMLPQRTQQGGLCYPRVSSKPSWRTGHQIVALAKSNMLEQLSIIRKLAYRDLPTKPLFKDYIEEIYEKKANANNPVQKQLYKLLLNQLYGKFAQRVFDVRKIVPLQSVYNDPDLCQKYCVQDLNAAALSDYMRGQITQQQLKELYFDNQNKPQKVKHTPKVVSINRLDQSESQFVELVFQKNPLHMQQIGFLKRISLMVTGAARALMIQALGFLHTQFKQNMFEHIYYMDTDSFFLSQNAYNVLQQRQMLHQKILGKFQDEYPHPDIIKQVQFFAAKVYYYRTCQQGKQWHYKFKGLTSSTFRTPDQKQFKPHQENIKIFQDVLDENNIQNVIQQRWKRNFSEIVISQIPQQTISRPRRMVNPDGSTKFYETTKDFQTHVKNWRLTYNVADELFQYQYFKNQ